MGFEDNCETVQILGNMYYFVFKKALKSKKFPKNKKAIVRLEIRVGHAIVLSS